METIIEQTIRNWEDPDAVRSRLAPNSNDLYFLALGDLHRYLGEFATTGKLKILDLGAGVSPYSSLFPNSDYLRADIVPTHGLDFKIAENGTVDAPSSFFDLVLSTQVMEHVESPETYFREVHRVLVPGGKVIITTHGVWEDHGVPYDFQRWTGEGLDRDLSLHGFADVKITKITTEMRAIAQLFIRLLEKNPQGSAVRRVVGKIVRKSFRYIRPVVNRIIDRLTLDSRVISGDEVKLCNFYLIIAATATKPLESEV